MFHSMIIKKDDMRSSPLETDQLACLQREEPIETTRSYDIDVVSDEEP